VGIRRGNMLSLKISAIISLLFMCTYGYNFDLDLNTMALWNFNEGQGDTIFDISGNNNHGKIEGAAWSLGANSTGLIFDGVDDHIAVNDASSLQFGTNDFTIEIFFLPESIPSYQGKLISKIGGANEYQIQFLGSHYNDINDNPIRSVNTTVGIREIGSNYQFVLKEWAYYAFVRNNNEMEVYCNGQKSNNSSISPDISVSPTDYLIIGARANLQDFFGGLICAIRISDIARDSTEIFNLWQKILHGINGASLKYNKDYYSIYPNPFKDILNIKFINYQNINTVGIYDISGVKLFEKKKSDSEHVLWNSTRYPAGIYIIRIESFKGICFRKIYKIK
jgi:hypothetical protein